MARAPTMLNHLWIVLLLSALVLKNQWNLSEGMKELLSKHYTMLTCLHAYLFYQGKDRYQPLPADVFVVTYGRSGTMMAVNMLHQLRTGGDDTFDDVMFCGRFVVPITGQGADELNKDQFGAPPRIFWTHGHPWQSPANQRYVYVIRKPQDTVRSWYNFVKQLYQIKGFFSLEEFFFNCIKRNCFWPENSLWHHISSWWKIKKTKKDDVLWLHFEDMTNSVPVAKRTVRTVAKFANISIDSRLLHNVVYKVSPKYFHSNQNKFDIHTLQARIARTINKCIKNEKFTVNTDNLGVYGLQYGQRNVTGKADVSKAEVTDDLLHLFDELWTNIVAPATGYGTYSDMRADNIPVE